MWRGIKSVMNGQMPKKQYAPWTSSKLRGTKTVQTQITECSIESEYIHSLPLIQPFCRHTNSLLGTIRNFSAQVLCEWPRVEFVPLFLNIVSLCLDVVSPTLFQFAYPFKMEAIFLVPQVLVNSIYDTFIASKIPTTKDSFQIWKQIKVRRG